MAAASESNIKTATRIVRRDGAAAAARQIGVDICVVGAGSAGISAALEAARRVLTEQMHTRGLEGFGLESHPAATQAAGALVSYLRDTQKADLAHVTSVHLREQADHLLVDPVTLKHLEIVEGR